MLVYHIVLPEVWAAFDTDLYRAPSLEAEGFIHCSFPSQVPDVLKRYYGRVARVVILKIETDKLYSKLVEEPSTNNDIYPHIYGRINRNAIVDVEERNLREPDLNYFDPR